MIVDCFESQDHRELGSEEDSSKAERSIDGLANDARGAPNTDGFRRLSC